MSANPTANPTANNNSGELRRLLDLPPELREMIFKLVAESRRLDGSDTEITPKLYFPLKRRHLSGALVHRELHNEILPLFYKNNTFKFAAYDYMLPRAINKNQRSKGMFEAKSGLRLIKVDWLGPTDPTGNFVKYGHSNGEMACVIELPPFKFRPLIRKLVLSLPVPEDYEFPGGARDPPPVSTEYRDVLVEPYDWLYPIRELQTLGFTGLKELKVELRFGEEPRRGSLEAAREWCREKVRELGVSEEVVVTVTSELVLPH